MSRRVLHRLAAPKGPTAHQDPTPGKRDQQSRTYCAGYRSTRSRRTLTAHHPQEAEARISTRQSPLLQKFFNYFNRWNRTLTGGPGLLRSTLPEPRHCPLQPQRWRSTSAWIWKSTRPTRERSSSVMQSGARSELKKRLLHKHRQQHKQRGETKTLSRAM